MDACWMWDGQRDWEGYGFKFVRRAPKPPTTVRAHNLVYAVLVGAIPSGLQLDHLCKNTGCVNPRHLEPVTSRENTMRGNTITSENSRKTHCKRGHEFTDGNTYMFKSKRACRTCRAMHTKTWNEKRGTVCP